MRLLIFLLLFGLKGFSQSKLPTSGPITLKQIALVMYAYGEISPLVLDDPYSIAQLNAASHLTDKTAPFSLSDWYGYTGTFSSALMDTIVLRNNCPDGYLASSGMYSMPYGAYTSTESQELANASAHLDMALYAQTEVNGGTTAGLGTVVEGNCYATPDPDNTITLVEVSRADRFPNKDDVLITLGSEYPVASQLTVVIRVYGIDGGYRDYSQLILSGRVTSSTYHDEDGKINKGITGEIISVTPTSDSTYDYIF